MAFPVLIIAMCLQMTSVEESRNRFIRETAANEKEGGFTGVCVVCVMCVCTVVCDARYCCFCRNQLDGTSLALIASVGRQLVKALRTCCMLFVYRHHIRTTSH